MTQRKIEELDAAECWRLLATETVGRVAVTDGSAAHIWPVNFRVRGESVLFRTDRGGKAVDISAHPDVAFEVDGVADGLHWSVVLNGTAELREADEPGVHGGREQLVTQSPGIKRYFVFIVGTVTGRRFASARADVSRVEVVSRHLLMGLLVFGGLSALAGGVLGVAANGGGVPLSYLDGSPFSSYLVPGILLGIIVGGTQFAAMIAMLLRHRDGLVFASVAGFGMLIWIFAELAIISEYSPLQTIYLAVGIGELLAVLLVLGLLDTGRRP